MLGTTLEWRYGGKMNMWILTRDVEPSNDRVQRVVKLLCDQVKLVCHFVSFAMKPGFHLEKWAK